MTKNFYCKECYKTKRKEILASYRPLGQAASVKKMREQGMTEAQKRGLEMGSIARVGIKHSDLTKEKMSQAWTDGRHPITEKMLEALKLGRYKGKKHSEETRRKLSEAQKGKSINDNQRAGLRYGHLVHSNTKPELAVKALLESYEINYIHQFPIGKYTADFFIKEKNMVINVDGTYWHKYPEGRDVDRERDLFMNNMGYKVLTVWENEINKINPILEGGE